MLSDLHQRGDTPDHTGKSGPQSHLLRRYRGHRPPVLPVHRDEGGALCGQAPAPAVYRAYGAGHRGAVCTGLFVFYAGGGAAGDAAHGAGTGARSDDAAGLRHRVRLHRPAGAAAHAGGKGGARPVRRGAVQRLLRLRGGGGAGLCGRRERGAEIAGPGAAGAQAERELYRHADRRPGDQGHRGAVPHDDQPVGIPAAAAAGQRRRAAVPYRARAGAGQR